MAKSHPVVDELKILLKSRKDLKSALESAITNARLPEYFSDLQSFYAFVEKTVVQVPKHSNEMMQMDIAFYYVLSISPDEILFKDPEFQQWTRDYTNAWADFLNTDASTGELQSYIDDPSFRIGEYQEGPSGWHSFNQFFARQPKPGMRPLAKLDDPAVVLSPCDFSLMQPLMDISDDATVTIKGGITLKISELLKDCRHNDAFNGGSLLSGFLKISDYHRFHSPIGGKVVESRKIPGRIGLTIERDHEKGILKAAPKPGFQFNQDRGVMVIDSPEMGLVGLLPVGMAQISSVVITAEEGVELHKGAEFGYFQFGGSNMLMLTEKGRFSFDQSVLKKKHILQGSAIGRACKA